MTPRRLLTATLYTACLLAVAFEVAVLAKLLGRWESGVAG